MNDCPYCSQINPMDEACFAEGIGVCTREPGHDGPHVACGTEHQLDIWEDPR